jgi:lipoprotein-releasing system ATP-binding protein
MTRPAADSALPLALEAHGLTRVLGGAVPVTLVRDISLVLRRGEMVAITGASGSGKSSLLYLLGLLDIPTAGEIRIEGRGVAGLSSDELAALRLARMGFVFQFHFLLPEFDVLTNVMLPMKKLGRLDPATMRAKARTLLDDLGISDQAAKYPEQLSGGQRQRVALARALANDPLIVLADEPTGNLDSQSARAVFEILARLAHGQNRAVAVVTHEQNLAGLADRRLVLADGRLSE